MNANDIIEKCAEICDRYALKNHEAAVKASRRASRLLEIDSAQRETAEIGSVECEAAALEAAAIASEIRALKSSLPAETVSEAMVEEALTVLLNRISKNDFRIKTEDMRAALEAAFVLPGPQVRLLDNDARDGRWIIGYSYRRPFTPVILKKTEHGWVDDGNWYHGDPDFYLPVPMPALPATPKDGRE